MQHDNMVFVEFGKYCPDCKHYQPNDTFNPNIGTYDGKSWSGKDAGEEIYPCCDCLEVGARYGTEVPEKYEVKG